MLRSLCFVASALTWAMQAQVPVPSTPAPAPQHEANFEAERKQADDLFQAQKPLEALPLYEDLCRQDPTVAVFAERHAAGLLAKEATLPQTSVAERNARLQVHLQAMDELRRAQKLGDHSAYVRILLEADSKTLVGAIQSGVALTVGYTYHGKPEAQDAFRQAETAFGKSDWEGALKRYTQAAEADPAWYDAALYAGDVCFRRKDTGNAGLWFARAITIDPDRETAYRYWGDALFLAGDANAARAKFVEAVVAEPYGNAAYAELRQWAQRTGHQMVAPAIARPEFVTVNGELKIDPALADSVSDGRSAWLVYQQDRVAHGARTLNQPIVTGAWDAKGVVQPDGYRHTIAEEHAALRAMLAEIDGRIKAGTLAEAALDPSIRNIRALEKADFLGAWIAINAPDAGIRSDYPEYRSHHRKHLLEYVNAYLIR